MAQPRYACGSCGTWVCASCGWKRSSASLNYREHACAKCPSRTGTLTPAMHTDVQWWRHNDATELPQAYTYGTRPDSPPVTRTANSGPEFYRGVRMPADGPYARIDIASWKRGVDDCLKCQHPEEKGRT